MCNSEAAKRASRFRLTIFDEMKQENCPKLKRYDDT
ncbi:UNVERIFIED_ORG: hypothetical protein GGI66_002602 [Rhizobium esperanzae]